MEQVGSPSVRKTVAIEVVVRRRVAQTEQLSAFGDASRAARHPTRAAFVDALGAFAVCHGVHARARGSFAGRLGSGGSPGSAFDTNGSGSDQDSRGSLFALGRDPSAASSATVASARPWTLKQLREVVEELVAAKVESDARVRRGARSPARRCASTCTRT